MLLFLLVLLLDLDQELFQVESWVLGIRLDCRSQMKREGWERQKERYVSMSTLSSAEPVRGGDG